MAPTDQTTIKTRSISAKLLLDSQYGNWFPVNIIFIFTQVDKLSVYPRTALSFFILFLMRKNHPMNFPGRRERHDLPAKNYPVTLVVYPL